jgi:hypothetical protein
VHLLLCAGLQSWPAPELVRALRMEPRPLRSALTPESACRSRQSALCRARTAALAQLNPPGTSWLQLCALCTPAGGLQLCQGAIQRFEDRLLKYTAWTSCAFEHGAEECLSTAAAAQTNAASPRALKILGLFWRSAMADRTPVKCQRFLVLEARSARFVFGLITNIYEYQSVR